MAKTTSGLNQRKRRHIRVRKKVAGTPDRPRLSVFRSANHIYAQVIDDDNGNTIAAFGSQVYVEEFDDQGWPVLSYRQGGLIYQAMKSKFPWRNK